MLEMFGRLRDAFGPELRRTRVAIHRAESLGRVGSRSDAIDGIVLDVRRVNERLDSIAAALRARRLPPARIERDVGLLARYVVAHEFSHLLQYERLTPSYVEADENRRAVECAADIHGSVLIYQHVLASGFGAAGVDTLRETLSQYGVSHCVTLGHFGYLLSRARAEGVKADSLQRLLSFGLTEEDRDLLDGKLEMTSWAVERAARLLRQVFPVAEFVQMVAPIATHRNLHQLAGPASTRPMAGKSLGRTLLPPWRCQLLLRTRSQTVLCERPLDDSIHVARARFRETVRTISDGLRNTGWGRARAPVLDADELEGADFTASPGKEADVGMLVRLARGGPPTGNAPLRLTILIAALRDSLDAATTAPTSAPQDIGELAPLDSSSRREAAMLEAFRVLNRGFGELMTTVTAAIHRKDGGTTGVLPSHGILIDGIETHALLDSVAAELRGNGLADSAVVTRLDYLAWYIVAHEYSHLLQYQLLPRDSVEGPSNARVMECAADMTGAGLLAIILQQRGASPAESQAAQEIARQFGEGLAPGSWLDAGGHPTAAVRQNCVALGPLAVLFTSVRMEPNVLSLDSLERTFPVPIVDEDRELIRDRLDFTRWAVRRARRVMAEGQIATTNLEDEVVREASVLEFVRVVAPLAERQQLTSLKSAPSPRKALQGFVLRRSPPVPWECELVVKDAGALALCSLLLRTTEANARSRYDEALATLVQGLAGTRWVRAERSLADDEVAAALFSLGDSATTSAHLRLSRLPDPGDGRTRYLLALGFGASK